MASKSSIAFLASWIIAHISLGNTGVFLGAGNQVIPIKNDDVQLVREQVMIKLRIDEQKGDFGLPFFPRADVEAKFELKNRADHTVKLQVGFPFHELAGFADEKAVLGKLDFRASDAKSERAVTLKEGVIEPRLDPDGRFRKVFVWDEEFGPGEAKTLNVRYHLLMSIGRANSAMRLSGTMAKVYDKLDNAFPGLAYTFSYITRTAYTWRGPIEKAEFTIDGEELFGELDKPGLAARFDDRFSKSISRPVFLSEAAPAGFKREGHVLKWNFRDKVPEDGLEMAIVVLFIPTRPQDLPDFYSEQAKALGPEVSAETYRAVLDGYYSRILRDTGQEPDVVKPYFEPLQFLKCDLLFENDRQQIRATRDALRAMPR